MTPNNGNGPTPDPIVGKITLNLHQSGIVTYAAPNSLMNVMAACSQAFLHMAGSYMMQGSDFIRTALVVCSLSLQAAVEHQADMEKNFREIQGASAEPTPAQTHPVETPQEPGPDLKTKVY